MLLLASGKLMKLEKHNVLLIFLQLYFISYIFYSGKTFEIQSLFNQSYVQNLRAFLNSIFTLTLFNYILVVLLCEIHSVVKSHEIGEKKTIKHNNHKNYAFQHLLQTLNSIRRIFHFYGLKHFL